MSIGTILGGKSTDVSSLVTARKTRLEALYVSWELHGDPVPPVQLKEDPMLEAQHLAISSGSNPMSLNEDVPWVRNGDVPLLAMLDFSGV